MHDPEYAKAFHRKILILEGQSKFKAASETATWCLKRFDSEFEDPDNRKIVPLFRELQERCDAKIPEEAERRERSLKEEVEREWAMADPNYAKNLQKEKETDQKIKELLGSSDSDN